MIPTRLINIVSTFLPNSQPHIQKLMGDASARDYYRISAQNQTFIAMVLPQIATSHSEELGHGATDPLSAFVDILHFLRQNQLPAPQLWVSDPTQGILILQDFGDQTLLQATAGSCDQRRAELYNHALDQLQIFALADQTTAPAIIVSRRFDQALYNAEFDHFLQYGLDKRFGRITLSQRRTIAQFLYDLTYEYMSWPLVICHRDYHSRNLMVLPEQPIRLGLLDFQDALLGPIFYDLASLIRDSYVDIGFPERQRLSNRYRLQLKDHNMHMGLSEDGFFRATNLMAIHRNLKAAGRFFFIDEVKHNSSYLPDIPRTLSYVKQTLDIYEEFKPVRAALMEPLEALMELTSCIKQ